MKKILLALVLILALAYPSYAGIGLYGNPTPLIINKDRNSPVLIALYDIDNTGFSTAEMAAITKVEVQYTPGTTGTTSEKIDSATYPAGFNWTTFASSHQLWMDIGLVAFTAGRDRKAELIVYTATWTAGRVVGLLDMQISTDAVRDATTIDPLVTSIGLADINDVDTAGATGTVLTKKSDGTFDFQAPVIGDGTGDVIGPESAVDGNFASFDLTTGKLIKDSGSKAGDFAAASHNHTGVYIGDAPSDGAEYLRKDGAWAHPSASAITGSESAFDGWDKNAGDDLALGDLSTNAYYGDKGKAAYDHSQTAHAPATAEQNVQADWNEADSGSDAYIVNKPSLFTWDYDYGDLINKPTLFSGAYADLSGLPTLFSGSYNDLTDKPTLFDGTYSSLSGIPSTFTPSAHASTHATGGSDALTPADIDAEPAFDFGTGVGDINTDDIPEGSVNKYEADTGTNTGDETANTIATKIHGATGKTTPADADEIGLIDSAASYVMKVLTWANLKATLKTYFDGLYLPASTPKGFSIKFIADDTSVTTGDGKFIYVVPVTILTNFKVTGASIGVTTASSSGLPEFRVYNLTDSVYLFDTNPTIDVGEYSSVDATTAAVINTSNNTLSPGDRLRIDVVTAGTGTQGGQIDIICQAP